MENLKLILFGLLFLTATFTISVADDDTSEEDEEAALLKDDKPYEENGVMVLEDHNFDQVVNEADTILVEFYAPWCGHCKKLAPEYEQAAKRLKDNDPPIALAKVDATVEEGLAKRFDIGGYPTLKWFRKGAVYDYDGPRMEEGIVQFMRERADPNWKPPPEAVVTLTSGNFTEVVDEQELMLVEFYAPWCGHCKKLAPEYEKAAQDLKYKDPSIMLAKVDATAEPDVASKFDVSGYPTLKIFRKGKPYDYKGERTHHAIVDYMKNQEGDASKEKSTLKDAKASMKVDDVTVMAFFDDKSDLYELYQEAANTLREEFEFMHTFTASIRKHYKVNANSVVVFNAERFYTKYEPKWHVHEIKAGQTAEEIKAFIVSKQVPLLGHMNWQAKDKRYKETRPLVLFFFTVDFSFHHRDATQAWRQKIADIAKDYPKLTFAIADEDDFSDIFKGMGFEDSSEEMNVGILGEKDIKYPMPPMEEWDTMAVRDFLDDFTQNKIKPKLKSQKPPTKQKAVKVVVGSTFEKIVLDPKKDVLIEFYAPWCGHCKKLEPVYKELAKKYKKEKHLVIAKIDATANEAPPPYVSEGYPTIYFAPSNNKGNPIKFEGKQRDLEDLEDFIKEHATVPVGVKDEL